MNDHTLKLQPGSGDVIRDQRADDQLRDDARQVSAVDDLGGYRGRGRVVLVHVEAPLRPKRITRYLARLEGPYNDFRVDGVWKLRDEKKCSILGLHVIMRGIVGVLVVSHRPDLGHGGLLDFMGLAADRVPGINWGRWGDAWMIAQCRRLGCEGYICTSNRAFQRFLPLTEVSTNWLRKVT